MWDARVAAPTIGEEPSGQPSVTGVADEPSVSWRPDAGATMTGRRVAYLVGVPSRHPRSMDGREAVHAPHVPLTEAAPHL